jgi:tripeptidyl-peptidase-1
MTKEEVISLIEPSEKVQMMVINWIKTVASTLSAEHKPEIVNERDAIMVRSTALFAETLFQTKMHVFVNERNRMAAINHMGPLSIPTALTSHITLVSGITELPPVPVNAKKSPVMKRQTGNNQCNVPYNIKNLYNIPQDLFITNNQSQIGIYAMAQGPQEGYGLQSIEDFEAALGLPNNPITCILGNAADDYSPNDDDGEANLDMSMITGMAPNVFGCFFIMDGNNGWMYEFTREIFSTPNAPLVISMSYGWNEDNQCDNNSTDNGMSGLGNCTLYHIPDSQTYVNLTNIQFQKLGLIGHTVLSSSGDGGVAGNHGTTNNCLTQIAIFPTASPYLLSVGATSIEPSTQNDFDYIGKAGVPPICQPNNNYSCVCSTSTNEQPALSVNAAQFDTGGGFSFYSPQPAYQQKAVQNYLKSGVQLPAPIYFNPNNRGYPDVSSLGGNICVMSDGACELTGGTSASTPLWAGIIAHLNNDRFSAGKKPIGFINQVIYNMFYQSPTQYFNNGFSVGNNNGGCPASMGFNSQAGQWTPLTGVGSPKFDQIRKYVAGLP